MRIKEINQLMIIKAKKAHKFQSMIKTLKFKMEINSKKQLKYYVKSVKVFKKIHI
jgi:hypothetical protein